MTVAFELSLPRDAASVPVARHICRDALADLGVAIACVHDIELAVTEACTNVLKHTDGTDGDYRVAVEVDDSRCRIRVIDAGEGFEHERAIRQEAATSSSESGRGIQLMRALVDRVRFVSKPRDGTVVHLEKELDLVGGSVLKRLVRTV